MHVRLFTAAVTAAALCACVSEADMSAIERAAASFHQHQAAGEHRANYDAADATFRAALPAADFERINEAIRNAEGCSDPVRDPMNYRSSATTSGNFVMVVYNRTCTGGPLVEQFTFKIVGGVPRLSGYYVSGMALFPSATGQPAAPPTQSAAPENKAPEEETPPPGNRT
ncbi:hypothetical protein [Terricaulis sp.]|uniref:hypothetical protein n=1 Tax=Terricaulis sp. TaxID=2768686 RepID=UPI003782F803